ncbi:MAG: shikimate dehydrogenase [Chloroflexota bacterium]|nr:shikimate dehydrogenase [Chloroflexota bacterium]
MTSESLTFSVLGHRIGYSASPHMMGAAFAALGLPHRYVIADVTDEDLADAVESLREDGFGGANVTAPHKLAVAALVDARSSEAEQAGAVNTIVKDGRRLIGHNTDLPALVEAIHRLHPDGPARAVILGGGGAARAVALALAVSGAAHVATVARGDGSWADMEARLAAADLIVNATPIGTQGDETPVPLAWLRPDLAVLDLVYRPSPTRLVREARSVGARAEAGAGVLLGQGHRSLALWLGSPAPVSAMADALRRELGPEADV